MKKISKNTGFVFLFFAIALIPVFASAHEAYVVPKDYFWQQIVRPTSLMAFQALKNAHDLNVTLRVVAGVLIAIFLNFLFRQSDVGIKFHNFLERFSGFGPIIVRITIASAFFFGVMSGNFLGPELSIGQTLFPFAAKIGLYISSIMILLGFFTEVAAIVGLIIFTVSFFSFGLYLVTYLNYLGELLVLLSFGSRSWSIDSKLLGKLKGLRKYFEKYEIVIVRIFYGAALIYAAIDVKLLHTDLTLRVIKDWHLTQFHWLFPSDPLLVVLGAGLAEMAIGLFIILGFEMRLTVLVSLFYITLSLLYFRELVWPHILLYGISFSLLIQPETFTIDKLLFSKKKS